MIPWHPRENRAWLGGSAGEATIVVILAAILCYQRNNEHLVHSRRDHLLVYASDQTHTVVKKACRILGIQYCVIKTAQKNDFGRY